MSNKKILIIRFSSIGDIVLTTPVIRCLKLQLPNAQIHFVTKKSFSEVLHHNPYLDKVHVFDKDLPEIIEDLKSEKFDLVVDLHNNLRSFRLKQALGVKSSAFRKLNIKKLLAVHLKMISTLPSIHIVQRYLETVSDLGIKNDGKGLDYFLGGADRVEIDLAGKTGLVIGGSYYTKKIPIEKLREICGKAPEKIVLLGGREDMEIAKQLEKEFPGVTNACGRYTIGQSAYIVSQCARIITSDTGLMHIASAFNKPIISLWGNTIPEFGMGPYLPHSQSEILEVKTLGCRPCSKLGYHQCPKKHFKCMMDIDVKGISF